MPENVTKSTSKASANDNLQSPKASSDISVSQTSESPVLKHTDPRLLTPENIISLQRLIGNQAVQRMIKNSEDSKKSDDSVSAKPAQQSDFINRHFMKRTRENPLIQRDTDAIQKDLGNLTQAAATLAPEQRSLLSAAMKSSKKAASKAKNKVATTTDHTFGTDFTSEAKAPDEWEGLPDNIKSIATQLAQAEKKYQQFRNLREHSESNSSNRQQLMAMEVFAEQERDQLRGQLNAQVAIQQKALEQAVQAVQDILLKDNDVAEWGNSAGYNMATATAPEKLEILEAYRAAHPIEYRKKELDARNNAFASIPEFFHPVRNTAEGQLLSDVKQRFVANSLDDQGMEVKKEEKKAGKQKVREQKGLAKRKGIDAPAKGDKINVSKDSDKITDKTDQISENIAYAAKTSKIVGTVVTPVVKTAGSDDMGITGLVAPTLNLGGSLTDVGGSLLLIKDGNQAQKKLGYRRLYDGISSVFKTMSTAVRRSLSVAEAAADTGAADAAGSTLETLGIPIVGIVSNTALLVKSTVDAAMQGVRAKVYSDQNEKAQSDSQSKALSGAIDHGWGRSLELMSRNVANGVRQGLALVGDILTLTGVGAIAGESIKMITRTWNVVQKGVEAVRDSNRAGVALESQYKAKVGERGAEEKVFGHSPKYASTALLLRAVEGDPVAVKIVKSHGISKKMLAKIQSGDIPFKDGMEIILHDWKEKEKPKTLGMKLQDIMEKIGQIGQEEKDVEVYEPNTEGKRKSAEVVKNWKTPEEIQDAIDARKQFTPEQLADAEKQRLGADAVVDEKDPEILDKLKDAGKTVLGGIASAPGAIWDATKKIGDVPGSINKAAQVDVKLVYDKWEFIKEVKDAVNYGNKKRRGNWALNSLVGNSSDDVEEQLKHAYEMLGKKELWFDNMAIHDELDEKYRKLIHKEKSLQSTFDIKEKKKVKKTKLDKY